MYYNFCCVKVNTHKLTRKQVARLKGVFYMIVLTFYVALVPSCTHRNELRERNKTARWHARDQMKEGPLAIGVFEPMLVYVVNFPSDLMKMFRASESRTRESSLINRLKICRLPIYGDGQAGNVISVNIAPFYPLGKET